MSTERVNFFISHAGADRAWAEWVAWQFTEAGSTVELDVWDWAAGQNFVLAMSDALARCDRVVALFSAAYFDRDRYTTEEWTAALLHRPGTEGSRLVPVRVEEVPPTDMPDVLQPLVFVDLFGVDADEARRVLLAALAGPKRPDGEPVFPGRGTPGGAGKPGDPGPRLPGSLPRVWNIPARNPGFTGRDGLLVAVRERLLAGDKAVVQAFQGMGGVGKTQLAAEYAHRFAGTYDLAWWVNSEQAGLIGHQFAALGTALGCLQPGAGAEVVRAAVLTELRGRGRWLLVFDNANNSADITGWLPGGRGHVLITSRERKWAEIAAPVEVDVFARAESVAILRERVRGLSEADAGALAEGLGDLPLGIAQSASYLADSGMPPAEYLDLVRTRAAHILDQGQVLSYPTSLAGATQLTIERLTDEDAGAAALAEVGAFLAPEPIPLALFPAAAGQLPEPLAEAAADVLAWRKLLTALGRSSLARIDQQAMQMHRLTQAILRDSLPPDRADATRALAGTVLAASNPGNPSDPVSWPVWAQLLPHILAIDPAASSDPDVRGLACDANRYLLMRGDIRGGHDLAQHLYQRWTQQLGSDDYHTLQAAHNLALSFRQMGRYAEARPMDEDTLARRRRVLGEDHPETLRTASNLANDLRRLGEVQAARELDEDTLERRRRLLGEDHRDTLASANNLAFDLRDLGEVQAARELDEDTLARKRRVLGEDHPSTLGTAGNLAIDLRDLGEVQAARELDQDTLERRRRVLGEDHPDTLISANNLAIDLSDLGEVQAARELDEDTLAHRRRVLGEDHPETLRTAGNLANDLRRLGEVQAARELDEDTLERRRRLLGEDHRDTLASANNLAFDLRDLGEVQAARELDEDTLARKRRVLGEDHPETLRTAGNLAIDLRRLGEVQAARELDEDTEARRRRLRGGDGDS